MEVSIIIPTKNRTEILRRTLASAVEAVSHLKAEIVVVDDASTATPEIPNEFTNVRLLRNPGSGVASARNFGAKHTTNPLILFLDNDILITSATVDHIISLHEEFKNSCFNLNWTYPPELIEQLAGNGFGRFLKRYDMITYRGWYNSPAWKEDSLFAVPAIAGFHLSIMRSDFLKTGGYEERFPFAGFEDYDFPKRLQQQGIRQFIDSRVFVLHNEVDRLGLENWLTNWERRSASRKAGVRLGYNELALSYSPAKSAALKSILAIYPLLIVITQFWPNFTLLDSLFFKLIKGMQAASIYRGYTSILKQGSR
jgi:GT2 family glycosyltransferase